MKGGLLLDELPGRRQPKSTERVQALSGYYRVFVEHSSLPEPVPVLSYLPLHGRGRNGMKYMELMEYQGSKLCISTGFHIGIQKLCSACGIQ